MDEEVFADEVVSAGKTMSWKTTESGRHFVVTLTLKGLFARLCLFNAARQRLQTSILHDRKGGHTDIRMKEITNMAISPMTG